MNPARTLAERFRTQRTDRIRVDGDEVVSVVELRVRDASDVELTIESCRDDVEQLLVIRSRDCPIDYLDADDATTSQVAIPAVLGRTVDLSVRPENATTLHMWNAWRVDGTEHAWTGNAGMIVELMARP